MKRKYQVWFFALLMFIFMVGCGGGGNDNPPPTPPSAPTGVTAAAGNAKVTISWNLVSGAASYNLYMASVSGVTKANYNSLADGMQHLNVTSPSTPHTDLINGKTYYFVVTAVNAGGESVESAQVSATPVGTQVGTKFTIATTPEIPTQQDSKAGREFAISAAFDGTNYLVGIQGDATGHTDVTAQRLDQSGNLVGPRISVGGTGGAPFIAFNGTNYLMVWAGDAPVGSSVPFYGQFITKDGNLSGSPFQVDGGVLAGQGEIWGISSGGGGNYLVVYQKSSFALYGRIISPSVSVGNEFLIGTAGGPSSGLGSVAFDGVNFLVVWDSQPTIKGRFIGTNGNAPGSEFTIHTKQSANCDAPVNVAFDGTNYLVVWHDGTPLCNDTFNGTFDLFGQIVTPSGSLSGGVINISVASGDQILPSMAFDGTNYLVTWLDMRNDANHDNICDAGEGTCWDIYGQYISKTGALVGSEFVINNDSGNQFGFVSGFNNGKYLVLENYTGNAAIDTTNGDVFGQFITP